MVGHIQSYLGVLREVLLEPGQSVEGVMIAQDDNKKIRRPLSVAQSIRFMRYRGESHLER